MLECLDVLSCLQLLQPLTPESTFVHLVWHLNYCFLITFTFWVETCTAVFSFFLVCKFSLRDKTESDFQLCCATQRWHPELRLFSSRLNSRFFSWVITLNGWAELNSATDKTKYVTRRTQVKVKIRCFLTNHVSGLLRVSSLSFQLKMKTTRQLTRWRQLTSWELFYTFNRNRKSCFIRNFSQQMHAD